VAGLKKQNIGIFGGTFDPPHLGHLILASEACYQLGVEHILWVLTPNPPHKPDHPITPLEHRLDMLQAAIADEPCFRISYVEIERPGPHYAVDTLKILRLKYPNDRLVYLMGGDSLKDLPNWHDPIGFIQSCNTLGVMHRPGKLIDLTSLKNKIPEIIEKTRFIEAPMLEISSTLIRQHIREQRPYRYYLLPRVYNIIQERSIYR
jgi:nicotinate-nucleotide adenylyltransferase